MIPTLLALDTSTLLWARSLISPEYARYVQVAGELIVVWWAIILVGIWLLWTKRKQDLYKIAALNIAFTIILTFLIYSLINFGIPKWRESPQEVAGGIAALIPHPLDNSFPSGHALFSAALLVGIWRFFRNTPLFLITLIIALVTVSARVIGGVHYPGDILGGFFFGGIGAYGVSWILGKSAWMEKKVYSIFLRVASWIRL